MRNSIILVFLSFSIAHAQPGQISLAQQDSIVNANIERILESGSIESFLPPLRLLLDSAVANSPEVEFAESFIRAREYDVDLAKKDWWSTIRLGGQVNYGTFGNQILDEVALGQQVNVNVLMPLSTWVGRSERIGKAEAFLDGEHANKESARRLVEQQVIALYNDILTVRRKLEIVGSGKESASIIKESAEMRFREGELTLDQLNITMDFWVRQSTLYEDLRAQFSNSYYALERVVGVPFSKFEKY